MIESAAAAVTYLFSDIEGSTKLWESDPARAAKTLAWHDDLSRGVVARHGGNVVKMTGDGLHAAFEDAADAVGAAVELQLALAVPPEGGVPLAVRCGLHLGSDQRRDNDFFGPAVNRAARIMSAAHGGQVLLSRAVAERVTGRLPPGALLRDVGAVRLRDLGSPEHLYQLVHSALRSEFPPLRSMASAPNNLSQQLNSFVGRDRDMEQVRQLLANSRLLTLLGMGGLGKSRLSMQVAAIVLEDYPDGVWFVELAPVADPNLVPQATASVLGVREEPGGTVLDALCRFVRDRKLLIVLDNCEHVVQACADLAKRLLQSGPEVRVLASSRDSLRIAGETVFQVAPLSAPDAAQAPKIEALTVNESVRLFVDRASAVQPAFRLSERNAAAVAEICRRLDGIPLALELAAARTRSMTVETIAARLNDRFRLLTSGDRTLLPRQQTLRALIDWSYDMLPASERTLLQRLSVFSGGCTLDAVESVCVDAPLKPAEIFELLGNLVEKSLVVLDLEKQRYRMLDTVRHYAVERFEEAGDGGPTRSRHLAWCLALAESAREGLVGPDSGKRLHQLDLERENLLAAHRWCDSADDGARLGLELSHRLKMYWYQGGQLMLGHRLATEALARISTGERSFLRCRGLADVGQFCGFMGRQTEAQRYLEESLSIARERGDQDRVAAALQSLGYAYQAAGDFERAQQLFDEAVEVARSVGEPRQLASALVCLGQLLRQRRDLAAAERHYKEATEIARGLGDQESVAIGQLNLAMVAIEQGNVEGARSPLAEALAIASDTDSQLVRQAVLDIIAGLSSELASHAVCARFFGAAEALHERSGFRRDGADNEFLMPRIERSRAALGAESFARDQAAGAVWSNEESMQQAASALAARTTS
jgi:predicted ATPase/class 3 adenylate cyclase